MSAGQLRSFAIAAVAVLALMVLFARRSRTAGEVESERPMRAAAPSTIAARAAGGMQWKGEAPRRDLVVRDDRDADDRAARSTPAAARGFGGDRVENAGAAGDRVSEAAAAEAKAVAANRTGVLAGASTASGTTPSFAGFGGSDEASASPSEEQNVDYSSAAGAYFPPNAVLGYPDRGGLQVEAGTVMFWIQPVDWNGSDDASYSFFLLRDVNTLDHQFSILKNQGSLRYQIINADGVEFDLFWPIIDWVKGDWHHVAATWGNGLMDLYVDGGVVGEQMIEGTPSVQPNSPAYWGSQRGTFGAGGILADGRIFDTILSERDIAAVAQQPPQ